MRRAAWVVLLLVVLLAPRVWGATATDTGVNTTAAGAEGDLQADVLIGRDSNPLDKPNRLRLRANDTGLTTDPTCANACAANRFCLVDVDESAADDWRLCIGTADWFIFPNTGTDVLADTQILVGTGANAGNYVTVSGDATLANTGALTVVDDSHNHTSSTISGLDISADTNLTATAPITLTGDDVGFSALQTLAQAGDLCGPNQSVARNAGDSSNVCITPLTAEVDGSTTNELQNLFETIACPAGTNPVADSATDTLAITGTAPITVTGNSTTDTVTIAVSQNAGTDITADLEEETHASEHSLGGGDAITVTNLASACTDAQVLGGNSGGTGVECQTDDDVPEAADFSNLTGGTGITNSPTGTLNATLGTAIDSSEITDATIAQVDVDDTATLAANPAFGDSSVWFATTGLIWEGATSNTSEGLLRWPTISADRTLDLPDEDGTLCSSGSVCTGYQAGPLSGDVVTSGAAATIQANSVALTTDTTGNYVTSASVSAPLSCTGCTAAEGGTPALSVDTATTGALGVIQLAGDLAGTGTAPTIAADAVALTTDTTGNYVASATASGGLTMTGTEGASLGVLLPAATDALSSTTSAGSGLQLLSAGLTLLQGCSDGQILKWVESTDTWDCSAVDGGDSGSGTTRAAGATIVRLRSHNTDCTTLTDGKLGEACVDEDDGRFWACIPSSGDCDTTGEWKAAVRFDPATFTVTGGLVALGTSVSLLGQTIDISDETNLVAGAGLLLTGDTLSTASTEAGFLTDNGATALTCGTSNQGKVIVLDDGTMHYCDGASTSVDQTVATTTFAQAPTTLTVPNGTGAGSTTTGRIYADTNGSSAALMQPSVGDGTTAVPIRQCFLWSVRISNQAINTTVVSAWDWGGATTGTSFENQTYKSLPFATKWTNFACRLLNDLKDTDTEVATIVTKSTCSSATDGSYMACSGSTDSSLSVSKTGTSSASDGFLLGPDNDVLSVAADTVVNFKSVYTSASGGALYGHCTVVICPDGVL